jgi:hypothetical protein
MIVVYYILAVFSYILFVSDRLILAISMRNLPSFATWAELHLPESTRGHKNVKRSLFRVTWAVILIIVFNVLTSCTRKDYYCDCVWENPVHGPQEEYFVIEANSKKSAAEHCENGGGVFFVDFECELR